MRQCKDPSNLGGFRPPPGLLGLFLLTLACGSPSSGFMAMEPGSGSTADPDYSPGPPAAELALWGNEGGKEGSYKIGDILASECNQNIYYNGDPNKCLGAACGASATNGTYGYLRQCTEFAARFACELFLNCKKTDGTKGKEGRYGDAGQWLDGPLSYSSNILSEIPKERRYHNGQTREVPRPGDLLIFGGSVGHVAVVRLVNLATGALVTLDQNTGATPRHVRSVAVDGAGYVTVKSGGNMSVLGWMRPSTGPLPACLSTPCSEHCTACDSSTGTCMQCQERYTGPTCDSCAPGYVGFPDCHPDTSPEIKINGGQFMMGGTYGNPEWQPQHLVTINPFYLDANKVSLRDYRKCVDAAKAATAVRIPKEDDCYWLNIAQAECNWQASGAGSDALPVNCIDKKRAEYYCKWAGKRLPTEEELEYVARGAAGALYPWGNDAPTNQLCWKRSAPCAIGQFPRTRFGALDSSGFADLIGNVAEWTSSYYCRYPDKSTCDFTQVITRGVGWDYPTEVGLQAFARYPADPATYGSRIGFRCARTP